MAGSSHTSPQKIGLLAGWGRFPLVVAQGLRNQGHEVYCLGVREHADPAIAEICNDFRWVGMAQLGRSIRYFRSHGVEHATMAGKIHKVRLYQHWAWLKNLPDWVGFKTFYPHFIRSQKDRKDDTLLTAVVDTFANGGITMGPATDYAPQLLIQPGQFTRLRPSATQWKDIEFGWTLAKEMGRLDVGQSIVVKDRAVLAVEAIEGTDECILRAGELCPTGGFTIVKVAKPQQDMRFDVPTIGIGTMQSMINSGAKILAVEADKTIIIDQAETIRMADEHKLIIVAIGSPEDRPA